MELYEKIIMVEAFLRGELEGSALREFERLRQENTITHQEIEEVRQANHHLTTALVQQEVLNTLKDLRNEATKPHTDDETRKKGWTIGSKATVGTLMAACLVGLYLTFSPITLNDTLVESIHKGAPIPNSVAVDQRQEQALAMFLKGRQYLESEQPDKAVEAFGKVLSLSSSLNERFVAFTEYNLSVAHLRNHAPQDAQRWYEAASRHGFSFKSIGWLTRLKIRWQIFWVSLFD